MIAGAYEVSRADGHRRGLHDQDHGRRRRLDASKLKDRRYTAFPSEMVEFRWGNCAFVAQQQLGNADMAWELRRNGRKYYYRSRRQGRVVKEYVGAGEKGRCAADADQAARDARREAARLRKERGQAVGDLVVQLDEFEKLVDLLVTFEMVRAGFRRHHRQWRASKNGRVRRRSRNT